MLRAVRLLVCAAAVVAPVVTFGGEKVVHLDVDGQVRRVRTYASSAPDLLRRVGLQAGHRDLVQPAGPLAAGAYVKVRRAKPIELVVDGRPDSVWVHGITVGEVLSELGLQPGEGDYVFPHPATPVVGGMQLVVRNAVHVKVSVDGRTRDVLSAAPTVGELLRQAGVRLGPRDRVVPPPNSVPAAGMTVKVVRVRTVIETQRVGIPYQLREVRDPKLEKGLRRVAQRGAEGLRVRRYATVLEDGRPVSRQLLEERVVRRPRDELVRVGTGYPVFRGGGHTQEGVASWYAFPGLGAAHRSIPLGTVVRVTNLANGRSVNVVIRDRGPFVDGRVIDLSRTAFAEIASPGSGTIRVRLEW